MAAIQDKILADLEAAAKARHDTPLRVDDAAGHVAVRGVPTAEHPSGELLEEYLWNSSRTQLVRICYIVWEHVLGEDHEWGRFSTLEAAERRIATLFSPGSLSQGEYYVSRLYTTRPLE